MVLTEVVSSLPCLQVWQACSRPCCWLHCRCAAANILLWSRRGHIPVGAGDLQGEGHSKRLQLYMGWWKCLAVLLAALQVLFSCAALSSSMPA
jgi:hypothetical protein